MSTLRLSNLFLGLAVAAITFGCGGRPKTASSPSPTPTDGAEVSDLEVIQSVLPGGWAVLETNAHSYPFYHPEGDGKLFVVGDPKAQIPHGKPRSQVQIWIMPVDYPERALPAANPSNRDQPTADPPQFLARGINAKLFVWPPATSDWPTMDVDLRRVLLSGEWDPADWGPAYISGMEFGPPEGHMSRAFDQAEAFLAKQPFAKQYAKRVCSGGGGRFVDAHFALLSDTSGGTLGTVRVDTVSGDCVWLGLSSDDT